MGDAGLGWSAGPKRHSGIMNQENASMLKYILIFNIEMQPLVEDGKLRIWKDVENSLFDTPKTKSLYCQSGLRVH